MSQMIALQLYHFPAGIVHYYNYYDGDYYYYYYYYCWCRYCYCW